MRSAEAPALKPFRVHFEDETIPPLTQLAPDPDAARKYAALTHPGKRINKVKIVRERA